MTKKDKTGQDSEDAALMELLRAIVAQDATRAARLLATSQNLARHALGIGASRKGPTGYFFQEIMHYVYAGDTALHVAAAAYQLEIARELMAKGAQPGARNRRGAEPLHYAADGIPGAPTWNPEAQAAIVEYLIEAGANPNSIDKSGVTPLHRAVRTRCAAAVRPILVARTKAGPCRFTWRPRTPVAEAPAPRRLRSNRNSSSFSFSSTALGPR